MPGPAPKRDAERTRTPAPKSGVARHGEMQPVTIPPVRQDWHPRAKELYKAFRTSGQSDYFQNSDWAYLQIVCDYLTKWYERPRAMDATNIEQMLSKLGATEGARRQVLRIELDRPEEDKPDAQLFAINGYENLLGVKREAL